jgi:hypothetical protein
MTISLLFTIDFILLAIDFASALLKKALYNHFLIVFNFAVVLGKIKTELSFNIWCSS